MPQALLPGETGGIPNELLTQRFPWLRLPDAPRALKPLPERAEDEYSANIPTALLPGGGQELEALRPIRDRYIEALKAETELPELRPDLGRGAYEYEGQVNKPGTGKKILGYALTGLVGGSRGAEAGAQFADRFFDGPFARALQTAQAKEKRRQGELDRLEALLPLEREDADRPLRALQSRAEYLRAVEPLMPEKAYDLRPFLPEGAEDADAYSNVPRALLPHIPLGESYSPSSQILYTDEGQPYIVRQDRSGKITTEPVPLPEGAKGLTSAGGVSTPYRQESLDLQRQRLAFQREALEERKNKPSGAGAMTQAQREARLRNLRSLVLRIRQHPVMGRQVRDMTDEELMEQEAQLTYGMSLDELRPGGSQPTPARPVSPSSAPSQALPLGWSR